MSAMKALLELHEQASKIGVNFYYNEPKINFTVEVEDAELGKLTFLTPHLNSVSYLLDMLEQKLLIPKTHGVPAPVLKAHVHLVRYALEKGHSIFVDDGGDLFALEDCTNEKQILEAIDAVESSELVIFANGRQIGWAQIIDQGEPTETVANNTITDFMEEWEQAYNKLVDN